MTSMLQPLIVGVDDDTDELFLLRRILQKTELSHVFQPFTSGEAALDGFSAIIGPENIGELPLLCFLDIKMAGMTGFDVLRWIRAQPALDAMPVLMLSSSDEPRDIDLARELGAQGFLKKYPSVPPMRVVLSEAQEFALAPPPRKAFLQWNHRFVEPGELVPAK